MLLIAMSRRDVRDFLTLCAGVDHVNRDAIGELTQAQFDALRQQLAEMHRQLDTTVSRVTGLAQDLHISIESWISLDNYLVGVLCAEDDLFEPLCDERIVELAVGVSVIRHSLLPEERIRVKERLTGTRIARIPKHQ